MRTTEIDDQPDGREVWEDLSGAFASASPNFTAAVRDKDESMVGWARGKVVLVVGELLIFLPIKLNVLRLQVSDPLEMEQR
jgi:hypothetical protein